MPKFNLMRKRISSFLLLTMVFVFFNCASVQEMMRIQKPKLSLDKVRFTGLNFKMLDLVFDVDIDNPNSLSTTLAGFDYDFILNNSSFLKGQEKRSLTILANSISHLEIPLQINFNDIYRAFKSFSGKDSCDYQAKFGLTFNLPILGKTRIPISKAGRLPLLKLPSIKISSLKLRNLGLSGAKLELGVQLNNPNPLRILLNKFQYNLKIMGDTWVSGSSSKNISINRNSQADIKIPIHLDFPKMGNSAYQLVKGDKQLDYHFTGLLNLDTNNDLLKNVNVPVDRIGEIKLSK